MIDPVIPGSLLGTEGEVFVIVFSLASQKLVGKGAQPKNLILLKKKKPCHSQVYLVLCFQRHFNECSVGQLQPEVYTLYCRVRKVLE